MKLPSLDSRKVLKILKKAGFEIERQKGSHIILKNYLIKRITVVPKHPDKTIKTSLLYSIINDTGLSKEDFLNFYL
ncbi:type II toxin-antitoxin system HicA family toxin [Candidatus Kuenenbacteria bacterium]|nr:type II toxin-antitoxin system HicA family toxin [Candidatus Kuenenbacteria bacterium]